MHKNNFSRFLVTLTAVLLVLSLALSLCSCKSNKNKGKDQDKNKNEDNTSQTGEENPKTGGGIEGPIIDVAQDNS